jgi:hypothetical protein
VTHGLLDPVLALVGLTGLVWLAMVTVRYVAVTKRLASARYYRSYDTQPPPEWIERPARAFGNLLEVPVLFYLAALLMLLTSTFDRTQIVLSWMFVGCRVVQAIVHVSVNRVPWRFSAYIAGCVVLIILWAWFAASMPPVR